jgi:uncharacterized integral membrane protein (TIGR00698 family)
MPATANLRKADIAHGIVRVLPGVALCLIVTAGAFALEAVERAIFGRAWVEALVLAILIGTVVRSLWTPADLWGHGIAFSAKYLLEIAVVLLGASVSTQLILQAGPLLLVGVAFVVALAIGISLLIGKAMGLPTRMALLVACGNSICGNSAIAAVAPIIGADSDDVAASIAFTAVLGVGVVLGLPVLGGLMDMKAAAYGAFTGLTVYAVPQVLAAASPMGPVAMQMGTLVKLVRVLTLGPVCIILSIIAPRLASEFVPNDEFVAGERPKRHPDLAHLLPWFIVGFLMLLGLRTAGLVPLVYIDPISHTSTLLTVISMAALGLGVDVRTVAHAGGRVTAAAMLSLVALGLISVGLLKALGLI